MRKLKVLLFAAMFLAGTVATSTAATLTLQGGSLSVALGALPPIILPGGQAPVFVSSGTGDFVELAGLFGPANVPLPKSLFTGVNLISGLTLANFGNGTKTVVGGVGTGGLAGSALVNVLQLFNLSIPLSVVGQAGATVMAGSAGIQITVIGQGWTTGVATVTGVTTGTVGTGNTNTALLTGSDNRTANHAGTITLVSGFQAITSVAGTLPGFAIQSLSFVPEPGTLLLLGSGVAGLAVLGRRRMRR